MPALRCEAIQLAHDATGARLIHLHAPQDTENLFSVSFPTPPPDDTGVPHILEHAVLSGSEKFPVRDPFFEMVKMSMATFINAMTGWDGTYYPVASNVKADLFNLAEVYFDAVFHPLLTEETFKREGHHLAPADRTHPTAALTISGIVYNEMKGAFSHPESRLYRISRALFPDTQYARESGGDPHAIPDLTHAALREFHRTFYHPSNAYFYCYGDVPTTDWLAFLEPRLAAFEPLAIAPALDRQAAWIAPRHLDETYPVAAGESLNEKTYLVMHWLTGDATDPVDAALWRVLDLVLLGNEAAPLRKAIVDAKLGQALIDSGEMTVGLENTFRIGIKGSEADRAERFAALVRETLERIARDVLEPDRVAAAFQQAAYHYLEVLPMFPLHTMDRVLDSWMYGADPLTFLRMNEHLEDCRARYAADPLLFNRMIRERLLANPHCLTVVLRPDPAMQGREDAAFAARMAAIRSGYTDDQMQQIATAAEELEQNAATPNTPEQLATLPQLRVADLPPQPREIPTAIETVAGRVDILRHDLFANGVNYLQFNLALDDLPYELWPYLPRYCEAINKLGAAGQDFEQVAHRVAGSTGGISCTPTFSRRVDDPRRPVLGLRFGLKTLDANIDRALGVLNDLLFGVDPRDRDRLEDVITQSLTAYRSHFLYEGMATASTRAANGLDDVHHLAYLVNGLPQLEQCERLHRDFDAAHGALMDRIESIRDFLLNRYRLTVSFTGSDAVYDKVRAAFAAWAGAMRAEPLGQVPIPFRAPAVPSREGLAAPIDVAYCVQAFPAPHISHPDEPLLVLGARMISADYILSEVRFKGNAYGAWYQYDGLGGTISIQSYRDPHVFQTLGVYAGVTDYVKNVDWTQADVDRAIIGSAKEDERPIRPGEATGTALQRHLVGVTTDLRRSRMQRMRAATPPEVKRAMLEALHANLDRSVICVVASREKLESANAQMPGRELAIEEIDQDRAQEPGAE